MKNNPSVTVIIPFKSNLEYLFISLKSAINQNYENFKIIIVYDNEDKSDLFKIKKHIKNKNKNKSQFISIIVNNKNLGAGYSRNKAIKKINTKYIAFLDSDDLWKKNKLKAQIFFMQKNNYVFTHTSYYMINKIGHLISSRKAKSIITFEELLRSCDIGLSTVILETNFIKKNKYYFPKIKTKEDFVLWLKILKNTKLVNGLDMKLTYYRKTKNSLSSSKFTSLINGYKVYRNYMKFNTMKSVYYLIILSINFFKKFFLKNK